MGAMMVYLSLFSLESKIKTKLEAGSMTMNFALLGVCRECNRGDFQLCDNEEVNGVTRPGGCKLISIY